jgi:hypothetical protein
VTTLAAGWLAEHVWDGFAFLAIIGMLGVVGGAVCLAWWALTDLWTWWRTQPPEFVSRHAGFFYFLEPTAAIVLGAIVLVAGILDDMSWVVIVVGTLWLLLRIEGWRNAKRMTEFQMKRAKEPRP